MARETSTRSTSTTPKRKRASSAPPASIASAEGADVAVLRPIPSHYQIAARALEIYRSRGADEGNALSDWLKAESELRA